jgi:hypothetical protein
VHDDEPLDDVNPLPHATGLTFVPPIFHLYHIFNIIINRKRKMKLIELVS